MTLEHSNSTQTEMLSSTSTGVEICSGAVFP